MVFEPGCFYIPRLQIQMNSDTIENMATDMERACDDDLVGRCDGCDGVREPCRYEESLVIYDCFHSLHAGCAHGRDACPRCHTPRRVHKDS